MVPVLLFFFLTAFVNATDLSSCFDKPKTVENLKAWNHPTKTVFHSRGIEIKQVELYKHGIYPVFTITCPDTTITRDTAFWNRLGKANAWWDLMVIQDGRPIKVACSKKDRRVTEVKKLPYLRFTEDARLKIGIIHTDSDNPKNKGLDINGTQTRLIDQDEYHSDFWVMRFAVIKDEKDRADLLVSIWKPAAGSNHETFKIVTVTPHGVSSSAFFGECVQFFDTAPLENGALRLIGVMSYCGGYYNGENTVVTPDSYYEAIYDGEKIYDSNGDSY